MDLSINGLGSKEIPPIASRSLLVSSMSDIPFSTIVDTELDDIADVI